jgi:hypothetical protein
MVNFASNRHLSKLKSASKNKSAGKFTVSKVGFIELELGDTSSQDEENSELEREPVIEEILKTKVKTICKKL